jgi:hypothetical protein
MTSLPFLAMRWITMRMCPTGCDCVKIHIQTHNSETCRHTVEIKQLWYCSSASNIDNIHYAGSLFASALLLVLSDHCAPAQQIRAVPQACLRSSTSTLQQSFFCCHNCCCICASYVLCYRPACAVPQHIDKALVLPLLILAASAHRLCSS